MRKRIDFTGETKSEFCKRFLGLRSLLQGINTPRMLLRQPPAWRTSAIRLTGVVLLALLSPFSRADEPGPAEKSSRAEIRVSPARENSYSRTTKAGVTRGGETIELKADLFRPENQDGSGELKPTNTPAAEFRWNVQCSRRALAEGCVDGELTAEGEAFRYKAPDQLKDGVVEITVTHATEAQAKDALVSLRVQAERERRDSAPGPRGVSPSRPSSEPTRRRPRDHSDDEKPRKGGRGGGRNSFGPSIRSRAEDGGGKKFRPRKSSRGFDARAFGDSWDMGFGGGYGGGGRSSSPKTNFRGYNRDNSAPVVSCSSVPRPGGGGTEVRCEQPAKRDLRVLRVRRRAMPARAQKVAAPARIHPPKKIQAAPAKAPARKAPAPAPKAQAPAKSATRIPSVSAAPTSQKGR